MGVWRGAVGAATVTLLLFSVSVWIRAPYLGQSAEVPPGASVNTASNTAVSVMSVNQWLKDGLPLYRHVVFASPPAFDTATPPLQVREVAYSPLTWQPLYLFGLLADRPVWVDDAQLLSLLLHLLVVLGSALLVYYAALPWMPLPTAALCAMATGALLTFLRGPLFIFFISYFPDMAVILFFAPLLLAEAMRDRARAQGDAAAARRTELAIVLLLFTGALVEWFVFILAATIGLKRVMEGQYGQNPMRWFLGGLRTVAPVLAALVLIAFYVTINKGWAEVVFKFVVHTGLMEASVDEGLYVPVFLHAYFADLLGGAGYLPLHVALAGGLLSFPVLLAWSSRRALAPLASLPFMASASCLIASLFLIDHHIENPHAALKFVVPFALSFSLLPLVLVLAVRPEPLSGKRYGVAIAVAAAAFLYYSSADYRRYFDVMGHRHDDNAAMLTDDVLEPDLVFATFMRDEADLYNGPIYYGRRLYPVSHLEDYLPRLTGYVPEFPIPPDLEAALRWFQKWNLTTEWVYPFPSQFEIALMHWNDEPVPAEVWAAAAWATRVVDAPYYVMYVLNRQDLCTYYDEFAKNITRIPEDLLEHMP